MDLLQIAAWGIALFIIIGVLEFALFWITGRRRQQ